MTEPTDDARDLAGELTDRGTDLLADLASDHGDPSACGALILAAYDEPHGPLILAAALFELFGWRVSADPTRPGTYRA